MIHISQLSPGITLRCISDGRFKHGCLSLQLIRPLAAEEAAMNALLPAVLLRGTAHHPDLRSITLRLDDLYGAGVGALVRRIGDRQTTGFYCSFTEDRYAMDGDLILEPLADFLRELLLEPLTEEGIFPADFVESEKKNLISTIASHLNDKRTYAMDRLMRQMCRADSLGIPRLGTQEQVDAITPEGLYAHYRRILQESPMELFYVGAAAPDQVHSLLAPMFRNESRQVLTLPPQSGFRDGGPSESQEEMDVHQGKLCMGFLTPITIRDDQFVAMQVMNLVFGGGVTGKLFMVLREQMSLCYAIGSAYHGSKGILTVSAGIDSAQEPNVRARVLEQLEACQKGQITQDELVSAREALISSLRTVHDSPGAMENYYASAVQSGLKLTVQEYMEAAASVTIEQIAEAAKQLRLHTVFFLKGVQV